jgi:hypothetical protein
MDMNNKDEIKVILQRILQSRDFKDSQVYKNLLSYLVNSSLDEQVPKEITIAIDVFGKDSSYNTNKDATVRYHVHTLRNKLENYYKNEGRDDKIRLFIPKGHYEIKFVSPKFPYRQEVNRAFLFLKRREIAVILVLFMANLYLIYRLMTVNHIPAISLNENVLNPQDKIWSAFFANGYPVSIILGDDFLLDEYRPDFQRYRQVRDWKIDSENDLNNFLIQHPQSKLWKSEITGIPFGGINNLMDILPIIYQFQKNVTLNMSSTLLLEKIQNQNIIYIGEFKNLRILNKIIFKTPIRYQYHPDERLFIIDDKGDTVHTFIRVEAPYEQKDKYNVDYSLLIKLPGFAHENLMFVVGFGYGGRLERTKILGDAKLRAELVEQILQVNKEVPEYFISVFEVKSIERTGFTNEMKYFKAIPGDFFQ